MRLFKWIFRIILLLVVLVILAVVVPIALMYKSVTPPDVDLNAGLSLDALVVEQMDDLIDDSNTDKVIKIGLDAETINREVKRLITTQMADNLSNEDGYIITIEDTVKIQGAWVELEEDIISINIGIHASQFGINFKTRVLLSIEVVEITASNVHLKINKLNIGNLPLKWALKSAPNLIKRFANVDIDQLIKDAIAGFGTYNRDDVSININIKDLLLNKMEDNKLMESVFNIIIENELVLIKIADDNDDNELQVQLNLNALASNKVPFVLDDEDRIKTEAEFELFMQQKLFNSLVSGKMTLDEVEITQLIDYFVLDSNVNHVLKQAVYKDYEVIVLAPYFEIDNKAVLNIPIQFGKNNNYFKTNISINIEFGKDGDDLLLNFSDAVIGTLELEDAVLESLMETIESEDAPIDGMVFRLKDFFKDFSNQGVEIENIIVSGNVIEFIVEDNHFLDVIEEIASSFSNPQMTDLANDILDAYNNDEDISSLVENLIEDFDNLSESEQEELLDLIKNIL